MPASVLATQLRDSGSLSSPATPPPAIITPVETSATFPPVDRAFQSALALSAPIDLAQHEGDLIPAWAAAVANAPFAVVVGLLGSVILIMAMNTAYVASSELLERVGHRYRFDWLLATNRRASLYRIHVLNALLYTGIILLTRGSQAILAEMYASRVGIGRLIADWGENFEMTKLLAGVILLAAAAMLFNEAVRSLEARCSTWRT